MIFVDSGPLFASAVPEDTRHQSTLDWMNRNPFPLITTDYVVDETLTLLRARGQGRRALQLGIELFGGKVAQVHYLTHGEILAAWQVFSRYADKEWSFTDCTSKVMIEKLQLAQAFSFDQHFRQFGTVSVVP